MDEKQWEAELWFARHMIHRLGGLPGVRTKAWGRKLRLYACACCRQVWDVLPDDQLRMAVETSERFADGEVGKAELAAQERAVQPLTVEGYFPRLTTRAAQAVGMAVAACGRIAYSAACTTTRLLPAPHAAGAKGGSILCDLLRCVFGNPFQKPEFNKKWRTETVTALAAGIYEERAFDRLPILADALEEAGCDDAAMLKHLRGKEPHCRGCWVLDLGLGK